MLREPARWVDKIPRKTMIPRWEFVVFFGGALVDKQAHVEVDKQVYTVDALETHPKIP